MPRRKNNIATRVGADRRGSSAIEFALLAPLLFGFVLGTIDISRYIWIANTMQRAADEAAREGAVQGLAPATTQARALSKLVGLDTGGSNFSASAVNGTSPNRLTLTVTHTYEFMYPIRFARANSLLSVTSVFPRP